MYVESAGYLSNNGQFGGSHRAIVFKMSLALMRRVILSAVGAPPAGLWTNEEIREWSRNAGLAVSPSRVMRRMPTCKMQITRNAK